MKIHFIAGLPRSGSTLLSAILRQNPALGAEMSSGLAVLFSDILRAVSLSEHSPNICIARRKAILRTLAESYYAAGRDVVFDTNRSWCNMLSVLVDLFPDSRVICCVRSPAWILNSMEQLIQRNPFSIPRIFGQDSWQNVYTRASKMMLPTGLIGGSLQAFAQAWYGPHRDRIIAVRYDSLVEHPAEVLERIYKFVGEERFTHDFESFEYSAEDFDERLGMPGLHRVKGPLAVQPRQAIIPPDLFQQYDNCFWESSVRDGHTLI